MRYIWNGSFTLMDNKSHVCFCEKYGAQLGRRQRVSLAPKMIKSRLDSLENTDIMNEVYFAKMKFAAWNINLSFEGSSNLKLNQKKAFSPAE